MPQNTTSKKQIAYDAIKEGIISGKYKTGEQLVERNLCEALGISRTPVREALIALTEEGLLKMDSGRGVFVAKLKFEDMAELYDLRESLECLAVKLMVDRATPDEKQVLKKMFDEEKECLEKGDYDKFMHLDMDFHKQIAAFSRNKRLYAMLNSIYAPISMMAFMTKDEPKVQTSAISGHQALMDAIMAGDTEKAVKAMSDHVIAIRTHHTDKYYLFSSED